MKLILYFSIAFFALPFMKQKLVIKEVKYIKKGESQVINNYDSNELLTNLQDLIYYSDEYISLYITTDIIKTVKSVEAVEISFKKNTKIKSKHLGKYNISKILIPLSGDYVGDPGSPSVIIFLSNENGYISGPLGCSSGLQYTEKIKEALNIKKNKNIE